MSESKKQRGHRHKHVPPLKSRCVSLTDDQVALLRKWGRGDMSAGLRWLIDSASNIVLRRSELDEILTNQDKSEPPTSA